MAKKKKIFSSLKGYLNRDFEESDIKHTILKAENEITELQSKINALKMFSGCFNLECFPFDKVLSSEITGEWVDEIKTDEDIGANEEIYLFEIKTDTNVFPVLLEYLGRETGLYKNIYKLHTPDMDKESLEKVKFEVLSKFDENRREKIIVIDQYNGLKDEIDKFFEDMVCLKDYSELRYMGRSCYNLKLFKKGETYKVSRSDNCMLIQMEDGEIEDFSFKRVDDAFGLVEGHKLDLEEEIKELIKDDLVQVAAYGDDGHVPKKAFVEIQTNLEKTNIDCTQFVAKFDVIEDAINCAQKISLKLEIPYVVN